MPELKNIMINQLLKL